MREGGAGGGGVWRRWLLRIKRRLRQRRGTEPRTRVQVRTVGEEHGGWWVCPYVLRPGDIVYSFQTGGALALERALLRQFDARVHLFDPDPEVADRAEAEGLLEDLKLYALRVGGENRAAAPGAGPKEARMVRLGTLMETLGHRRVDLVKLDMAESPAALQDLMELEVDVRQLLVSVPATTTMEERDRVEALVHSLERQGYRIARISPDGRRYSFLRTDFEAP